MRKFIAVRIFIDPELINDVITPVEIRPVLATNWPGISVTS